MSTLTAAGRRQIRDYRRERISRKLRDGAAFMGVPADQRDTLSELKLVGKDLYADIRQRGIILPDGSINPSVAEHRQNAGAQLRFILAVTELNRTQSASNATIDLVSLMSGQGEPAPDAAPDSSIDRRTSRRRSTSCRLTTTPRAEFPENFPDLNCARFCTIRVPDESPQVFAEVNVGNFPR